MTQTSILEKEHGTTIYGPNMQITLWRTPKSHHVRITNSRVQPSQVQILCDGLHVNSYALSNNKHVLWERRERNKNSSGSFFIHHK